VSNPFQVKFIHHKPNAHVRYSEKANWLSMSTIPKLNITANKLSGGCTRIDLTYKSNKHYGLVKLAKKT